MKRVIRAQSDYKSTLLRNQLTSLILFEAITTTTPKAKELIPFANRFFNKVKAADLNAKKRAHQTLLDKNAVAKTFEDLLTRYGKEDTTFVRSAKMAPRKGDNAPQTLVSLIAPIKVEEKPKSKDKKESTKEEK